MSVTCPNINLSDWKSLVAVVGKYEAYKDYLETDGKIRNPEVVKAKVESRNPLNQKGANLFNENPSFEEVSNSVFDNSIQLSQEDFRNGQALELANKMSAALGVEYTLTTPEEATEITKGEWNGEGGFFYNGTVYYLKDRLSSEMVFHEMAHPFVRAMSMQNSELFNKLYNDLLQTEEGKSIHGYVKDNYSNLEEESDYFKEEVIVRALTVAGMQEMDNQELESGFKKFIKELMYQIKQFARKVFGKEISISKLSPTTTLEELAKILSDGSTITIDIQAVSNEDIIAFNKELRDELILEVDQIKFKEMQENIDEFYDITMKHLQQLRKNRNFEELGRLLYDDFGRSDLAEMRSNLAPWQTKIDKKIEELEGELNDTKDRSRSFVDSIFRLESVIAKVRDHVEDIATSEDTQDNAQKAHYYAQFLDHYKNFIADFQKTLVDNGIRSNAAISQIATDIQNDIDKSIEKLDDFKFKGAADVLWDQYSEISRNAEALFQERLKVLNEAKAGEGAINSAYTDYYGMNKAEYNEYQKLLKARQEGKLLPSQTDRYNVLTTKSQKGLKITKDRIQQLLKGQAGDANWANSYLEGYMYNTDPIVGGLALYTKNALSEVNAMIVNKVNTFADRIRPLAEAAGVNYSQIGKLGQDLGFKDFVAKYNAETGKMEQIEVWTFLNEFKHYRYDADTLRKATADAYQDYLINKNPKTQEVYLEAKANEEEFKRNYMHSEYVDQYYTVRELLNKDNIGRIAGERREEIFNNIRALTEGVRNQTDELEISDQLDMYWREYRQLSSRYDLNGNPKQGEEAQIAERLREYRDQSREFYEDVPRKRAFEKAYFNFVEELKADGIEKGTPEYDVAMQNWRNVNTVQSPTSEYYDEMSSITNQIKALLSKIKNDTTRKIEEERLSLYKERQELVAGFRDDEGQPNGTQMSEGKLLKLQEIDEDLQELRNSDIGTSGLTKKEQAELNALYVKRNGGNLTSSESQRMNELTLKTKDGLSGTEKALLKRYYGQLAALSDRNPTDYYLDIINNYMSKMDTTRVKAIIGSTTVTEDNYKLLLNNASLLRTLFKQDPQFEKWFNNNHVEGKVKEKIEMPDGTFQYEDKAVQNPSYAWTYSSPTNKARYMEQYEITDESGKVVDVIYGKPTQKYFNRQVKSKYRTQKIVGKTVDNQYQWLPKSKEDMAKSNLSEQDKYKYINEEYFTLREQNKPMFDLLEAMKDEHLKNQEGLGNTSKLYYDFPRFRKSRLETLRTLSIGKTTTEKVNALSYFWQRMKEFFVKSADQVQDGLNHEQQFDIVRADMFDNEITNVPIAGLYNIEPNDVSTDITTTMMKYMGSAERQKQLVKMNPLVRAIQSTVSNPENAIDDLNKVNSSYLKNRSIIKYMKKFDNVRSKAVDNWIAKHWEGQNSAGITKDMVWLNNVANLMFKQASFSFFAFNIPSDLKNSLGMKFQQMIEAAGGQHVDMYSLQKGNAWSYKAMAELSFGGQLYTKSAKSHMQQMIQLWDPEQGRNEQTLGESVSRTPLKDVASATWMFSFRQWVQRQATIQLWAGVMYKQKLTQVMPDGSTKEIAYMDAFETVDGTLKLKKGIDVRYAGSTTKHVISAQDTLQSIAAQYNIPVGEINEVFSGVDMAQMRSNVRSLESERQTKIEQVNLDAAEDALDRAKKQSFIDAINREYDKKIADSSTIVIDNTKFNRIRNTSHQIINDMGGAYSSFDQPEAQRYLAFRFISFIRRYFTTMAVRRWGFAGPIWDPRARFNPGTGQGEMGFYIEFAKFLTNIVRTKGNNVMYMKPSEKTAALKVLTEGVMLYLSSALLGILFGYDDDDDDRFAKLRKKSGALPFFGLTEEDPNRPFNLMGFAEVHALHMMMQVRGENEQFNPFFGGLSGYTSLLEMKSIALGPTTDRYQRIIGDATRLVTGDPKAYYTRRVGAYDWQQKEEAKVKNRIAKMIGLTGKSIDPADAVQGFKTWQSMIKK